MGDPSGKGKARITGKGMGLTGRRCIEQNVAENDKGPELWRPMHSLQLGKACFVERREMGIRSRADFC